MKMRSQQIKKRSNSSTQTSSGRTIALAIHPRYFAVSKVVRGTVLILLIVLSFRGNSRRTQIFYQRHAAIQFSGTSDLLLVEGIQKASDKHIAEQTESDNFMQAQNLPEAYNMIDTNSSERTENLQDQNLKEPRVTVANRIAFVRTLSDAKTLFSGSLIRLVDPSNEPDYGKLLIVSSPNFERRIMKENDEKIFEDEKNRQFEYFETEPEEGNFAYLDEAYDEGRHECLLPTWKTTLRPTCNPFHEIRMIGRNNEIVPYLGGGAFRGAYLFDTASLGSQREKFVLKLQHYHVDAVHRWRLQKVHMEAAAMTLLSVSPYVSNIYGTCGTSVVVEPVLENRIHDLYFRHQNKGTTKGLLKQSELDQLFAENKDISLNNLTVSEKIDISTQIAESIAEAHGLPWGPLLVADITLRQWLYVPSGEDSSRRLILNDFDLSQAMAWNVNTQNYCKKSHYGGPTSPEKAKESLADESLDVWHVGSILYTVLTGLLPYYDELEAIPSHEHQMKLKEIILYRVPRFDKSIYSRTVEEERLLEIIEQCFEIDPTRRPTIFQVVEHLRKTNQMMNNEKSKSTPFRGRSYR
jgi:hypothetical protein